MNSAPGFAFRPRDPHSGRDGVWPVTLETDAGDIRCRLRACVGGTAIVWVFGSGGGLGGPAGGVYDRLGETLRREGVASLELDYRRPGRLADCVADVRIGLEYLSHLNKRRIVLVGHSFGGAVVIQVGAGASTVVGVAALSSQTAGTQSVDRISPRPLVLIHGEADEVLPADGSRDLFARAAHPKQLVLYPGCRHGLDQCRDALDRDLLAWLRRILAEAPPPA